MGTRHTCDGYTDCSITQSKSHESPPTLSPSFFSFFFVYVFLKPASPSDGRKNQTSRGKKWLLSDRHVRYQVLREPPFILHCSKCQIPASDAEAKIVKREVSRL